MPYNLLTQKWKMPEVKQCPLKQPAELLLVISVTIMIVALVALLQRLLPLCPGIIKEHYLVSQKALDNETAEMINRLFEQKGIDVKIYTNPEEFLQKFENYTERLNLSKSRNISEKIFNQSKGKQN